MVEPINDRYRDAIQSRDQLGNYAGSTDGQPVLNENT